MAVILLGVFLACAKKPHPKPGPAPEKDYGSDETAIADAGRGRDLSDMGFKKAFQFAPVYFDLNGTAPTAESIEALHTLVDGTPTFKVCTIEGHACPLGETAYNAALGYHRAIAVLNYLRAAGVRTGFQVISYGEEKPAALRVSEYWRNRRVTVECPK